MNFKSSITKVVVALLALSLLATPAMAAGLNHSAAETPNRTYTYDLEKAEHDMSWGASHSEALIYENNDGDQSTLDAEVNTSAQNPYSFVATDLEVADFGAFPHSDDDISALDADQWTSTAGASVDNAETAPGVDAVRVTTSGVGSGTEESATFSNFSVTSDEEKRFLQVGMDVDQLDTDASIEVRVIDEDGDKKIATLDESADPTADEIIGSEAGEGLFYQHRLGDLSTIADGDGDFDNIEEVEVAVLDADADVSISALNVDKLSQYKLGEQMVQNSDDEWESESITEVSTPGSISLSSLQPMGGGFDTAVIHELTISTKQTAALAPSEDVSAEFEQDENNTYPGYYGTAEIHIRNGLVDAYDLSYSNVKLVDEQTLGTDRYLSVSYAEDVGDTDFADIGDVEWSALTTSYSSQGSTVTVDETVQAGDESVLKFNVRLNQDEFAALQASENGGGGFFSANSGGPLSSIINWFAAGVTAIAGALGISRWSGSSAGA